MKISDRTMIKMIMPECYVKHKSKHLHSDEMIVEMGVEATAKHNEHSKEVLMSTYAVKEGDRTAARIKKSRVSFA